MLIFLHMHKCAGTYVVEAAQMSGFRLPDRHANGNLVNDDGSPLLWSSRGLEDIHAIIEGQRSKGVNFLAMEWDFPGMNLIARVEGVRLFTVIRDPLARAISNFRFDKAYDWIDQATRFADFIDDSGLYRSNNYYVKKLSNVHCRAAVSDEHLEQAISALLKFEKVINMDCCDLSVALKLLGLSSAPEGKVNTLGSPVKEDVGVSAAEARLFVEANAYDYVLFNYFHKERPTIDLPSI